MIAKLNILFFTVCAMLYSFSVNSGEHPLSTITGDQIDLKTYDHSIAGSIKDFLIWGDVNEATFSSELIMKRDGQAIKATFKKQDNGIIGGQIFHTANGRDFKTVFNFKSLDKHKSMIFFSLNGLPLEVTIKSDDFKNNHFINPTYQVEYNGISFEFTMKGQACYAYSIHLVLLIAGAYLH